jgi:uncharacterized protein
VPKYVDVPDPVLAMRVRVDGAIVARTEILDDVNAIARENLARRIGWIIARSVSRAAARGVASGVGGYQLNKNAGGTTAFFVGLGASLFSIFVEQADLRSWLTLPRNFQVARAVVPAGTRDVRLELLGPGDTLLAARNLGHIDVPSGSFVPIFARSIDRAVYAYVPNRSRISEPAP